MTLQDKTYRHRWSTSIRPVVRHSKQESAGWRRLHW